MAQLLGHVQADAAGMRHAMLAVLVDCACAWPGVALFVNTTLSHMADPEWDPWLVSLAVDAMACQPAVRASMDGGHAASQPLMQLQLQLATTGRFDAPVGCLALGVVVGVQ